MIEEAQCTLAQGMVALGTWDGRCLQSGNHTQVTVGMALLAAGTELGQERKNLKKPYGDCGCWVTLQHMWGSLWNSQEILVAEEEGRGPVGARRETAGTLGDG